MYNHPSSINLKLLVQKYNKPGNEGQTRQGNTDTLENQSKLIGARGEYTSYVVATLPPCNADNKLFVVLSFKM